MGLKIPALANLTYASKLKVVAHVQLEQGTRREQTSLHPQRPLLQSPLSVPHSLPLGLDGCIVGGGGRGCNGPMVPLLSTLRFGLGTVPEHCVIPGSALSSTRTPLSYTPSGPRKERSRGGHFSHFPRQDSLGSQRLLWPNLEFQANSVGLLCLC